MSELTAIGIKINAAIKAVRDSGLTVEELGIFEDYINHQETLTPILNPNFIQDHGFKMFDEAKERIQLLKPILELEQKEREGK